MGNVDPTDKAALRRAMKDLRAEAAARDPDAGERLAAAFNRKLLDRFGPEIGGYWPIGDEIDPRPLMQTLAGAGARLSLPRVADGEPMRFHRWDGTAESLAPGAFGLRQPSADAGIVEPTLILVPLLAFDGVGARLGYGKGHFDSYLAARRRAARDRTGPRVFACGLAFAAQGVETVPTEPHDERLDWVQTPDRAIPVFLMGALGGSA